MSDAKLWIDEVGCTATITGTNVSYTMPLWVLDVMRDIIWAEAEKEVEVTHSDFDTQQELLDRYRTENAKLRELVQDFDKCLTEAVRLAYIQGHMTIYDDTLLDSLHPRMHELGVEDE